MSPQQVVAITGAARGIGRATAEAFADRGAWIAIGDLDGELARRTASEITASRPGIRVIGVDLDVTQESDIEAFVTTVTNELGPVTVLVNNAGIMPTSLLVEETEDFTAKILDINVKGVISGTRVGLRTMDKDGVIVNIASQAALLPAPALATYNASKAGVAIFGEAMRRELEGSGGPHLMTVLPGIVRTELSAGTTVMPGLERFLVVNPTDVARAIADGVDKRRNRVFIPIPLGVIARLVGALPYPVRRSVERVLGSDRAFTTADPVARSAYHRRVAAQ